MSYARCETGIASQNPETMALFGKVVQNFLADHPDASCEYLTISGVPVSIDEAQVALFVARNLPVGGEHLDILDGDDTSVRELGLSDKVLAAISQPGVHTPDVTSPRHPPLLTVGELARCGARTLRNSWTRLQHDGIPEIIDRLATYAENQSTKRAKSQPADHLVTT